MRIVNLDGIVGRTLNLDCGTTKILQEVDNRLYGQDVDGVYRLRNVFGTEYKNYSYSNFSTNSTAYVNVFAQSVSLTYNRRYMVVLYCRVSASGAANGNLNFYLTNAFDYTNSFYFVNTITYLPNTIVVDFLYNETMGNQIVLRASSSATNRTIYVQNITMFLWRVL